MPAGKYAATELEGVTARLAPLKVEVLATLKEYSGQPLSTDQVSGLIKRSKGRVNEALQYLARMRVKGVRYDEEKDVFWYEEKLGAAEVAEDEFPSSDIFDLAYAREIAKEAHRHLDEARALQEKIAAIKKEIDSLEGEAASLEGQQRRLVALARKIFESAQRLQEDSDQVEKLGGKLPTVAASQDEEF